MSGVFRQDMGNRASVQAGEAIKEGQGLKFVDDGVLQVKKVTAVTDPVDAIAIEGDVRDATGAFASGSTITVQLAPGFCGVLLDADTTKGTNLKPNADAEFAAIAAGDAAGTQSPCMTVADGKANDLVSAIFFGSGRVTLVADQINP